MLWINGTAVRLQWQRIDGSGYRAVLPGNVIPDDAVVAAATFYMGANQEIVRVTLPDGRSGFGWTEQQAWDNIPVPAGPAPAERIQQGVGVVGVQCAACRGVASNGAVIVVNAADFARKQREFGAAYYICKACAARPDLEDCLTSDGDGSELLLP